MKFRTKLSLALTAVLLAGCSCWGDCEKKSSVMEGYHPPKAHIALPAPSKEAPAVVVDSMKTTVTPPASQEPTAGESFVSITYQHNWVSKLFPNTWEAVCQYNISYHGMKNCNVVRIGQKIYFQAGTHGYPARAEQAAKPAVKIHKEAIQAAKPAKVSKPKVAKMIPHTTPAAQTKAVQSSKTRVSVTKKAPSTPVPGEFLWTKLGGGAMCKASDKTMIHAQGWVRLGLTTDEIAELKTKRDAGAVDFTGTLKAGDRMLKMEYLARDGHTVILKENVLVAFPKGVEAHYKGYRLTSGGRLVEYVDVEECCNEGILTIRVLPPPSPPTITEAPPISEPPVITDSPVPPAPPVETPVPTPKKTEWCEKFDKNLLLGVEVEPGYKGAHSQAFYAPASAYCMWRGKTGWHGLGAKMLYASYHGDFGYGAGNYRGRFGPFFGPAYKYISDYGWDGEVGVPMFGTIRDRVRVGDYEARRKFDVIGVSAGLNWYQPKLDGKNFLYETQVNMFAGLVTGDHLGHSYLGRGIVDQSGLSNPGWYGNGAVREYLWRTSFKELPKLGQVEFYAQLGFLQFDDLTGNWRLGATFFERCVGVGVGQDFHFFHDFVPAIGGWIDVFPCVDLVRTHQRLEQIKSDAKDEGVTIDPRTGEFTFKTTPSSIESAPKVESQMPANSQSSKKEMF